MPRNHGELGELEVRRSENQHRPRYAQRDQDLRHRAQDHRRADTQSPIPLRIRSRYRAFSGIEKRICSRKENNLDLPRTLLE